MLRSAAITQKHVKIKSGLFPRLFVTFLRMICTDDILEQQFDLLYYSFK